VDFGRRPTIYKVLSECKEKCYHTVSRDLSCRPHEILKLRLKDIHFNQDVVTLNNVYLEYGKNALETLNEMILILPFYQSVSNLFHSFKNIDVDVEKYKLQGLLVIVIAKKGYFNLTNELVDITIMIKMLLQRSNKLCKSGLTVFSDMGLFFHHNRLDELLKHETRLFMSSSWITNSKMKIFCCDNVSDLNLLTDNQKQDLLAHHYRVI
jgi:hypothetical protein